MAERSKEGAEAARQSPAHLQHFCSSRTETTIKEAGERERPPHTVDAEPGRVLRGVGTRGRRLKWTSEIFTKNKTQQCRIDGKRRLREARPLREGSALVLRDGETKDGSQKKEAIGGGSA